MAAEDQAARRDDAVGLPALLSLWKQQRDAGAQRRLRCMLQVAARATFAGVASPPHAGTRAASVAVSFLHVDVHSRQYIWFCLAASSDVLDPYLRTPGPLRASACYSRCCFLPIIIAEADFAGFATATLLLPPSLFLPCEHAAALSLPCLHTHSSGTDSFWPLTCCRRYACISMPFSAAVRCDSVQGDC